MPIGSYGAAIDGGCWDPERFGAWMFRKHGSLGLVMTGSCIRPLVMGQSI
jgi:hypothetical protein